MSVDSLNVLSAFNNTQTNPAQSPYNTPSIYVICRDARKIGIHHGAWINALQSRDRVMEDIYTVLRSSPAVEADDWEISATEQFGDFLIDKNENLVELCEKAQLAWKQHLTNAASSLNAPSSLLACISDQDESVDTFDQALKGISGLGLTVEVCGTWIWVSGDTRNYRDLLDTLGFQWSLRKNAWYFQPEGSKRSKGYRGSWSMEKIRSTYGSEQIYAN
jgi:Antirestriction protein (ArdA)